MIKHATNNPSNKIRHEIQFKTKRVKYSAIWKKSIKIVKESKLSFFYHVSLLNFFYSLLHNFIIFAPHSWIPSSSFLLFSLHLLLISIVIGGGGGGGEEGRGKTIKMRRRRRKHNRDDEERIQDWGAKITKLWRRE